MTTIEDIKDAVKRLTPEQLIEFREWFTEFDADLWDRQMDRDAASGKLDALTEVALAEHRAGLSRDMSSEGP